MLRTILIILAFSMVSAMKSAGQTSPVRLAETVSLPGISGDMDHLAVDPDGHRLFIAAEDNGTLRVINLRDYKLIRTVRGFKTPHSILYLPVAHELYLTDGSEAVLVLDSRTLAVKKRIVATPGADSIAYDPETRLLYVVTGGKDVNMVKSNLSVIDTHQGKLVQEIPVAAAHVESLTIDHSRDRIFVNVTDKNYLAVIDAKSHRILSQWPIHEAEQNAPLAIDSQNHRLFVVCRDPGMLIVLDSETGKTIASFPTGGHADDVVYDSFHHRVYVPAGEGKLYSYQEIDASHFAPLEPIASAPGAKTAVLSPDGSQLYVAVSPGEGKSGAEVLIFDVQ